MPKYRVTQDQTGATTVFRYRWMALFWAWLFSGQPSSLFGSWTADKYTCTVEEVSEDA